MCGRIACGLKCDQICEISNAKNTGKNQDKYKSSYNVAPTTYIPIVYSKKQFKTVEKPVEIKEVKVEEPKIVEPVQQNVSGMGFGFGGFNRRNEVKVELYSKNEEEEAKYILPRQQNIVYYSVLKDHEEPLSECVGQEISFEPMKWGTNLNKYPVINIRQESLCYVPYYRQMLQRKNFCVTIVSGYFEWKEIAEGVKQPYYITSKDKYLILASLYDDFSETDEKKVVILTQDANNTLSYVHSRMPVILNVEEMQQMIKATSIREYYSILNQVMSSNKNLGKEYLEFYPVGNLVNKLTNQDESVIINKNDVEKDKDGNFTLKAFMKKNNISIDDKKSNKLITLKSNEEIQAEKEIKKSLELFENINNMKQLDKVIKNICIDSDNEEVEVVKTQNNKKMRTTQTLTQAFNKNKNAKINVNLNDSQDSKSKSKGKTKKTQSKEDDKKATSKGRSKSKKSQKGNDGKTKVQTTQNNKNKSNKAKSNDTRNNNDKNKKSFGNLDTFVSSSKKSNDSNSSKDI